jgi:5-methyltetrahydrofolate--homocysteine methyltransferase
VGRHPAEFMAEVVREVQSVTEKPLSIDTPDPERAEAGLRAYNPERAAGQAPILNSISALRLEMLDLLAVQPFMPILMVSERAEGERSVPNRTADEIMETAQALAAAVADSGAAITQNQLIFDPGIASVGSDMEGATKTTLDAIAHIHSDPGLCEAHISLGLSNFSMMLPPKRKDGSPVKSALESAFLTKAMPLGLDMVIGSVKRRYEVLPSDHPALQCLEDVVRLGGVEAVKRVMDFYSS